MFSFPPTTGMFRFVGFASPIRGCRASPQTFAACRALRRLREPQASPVRPCPLARRAPHRCGLSRGLARSRLRVLTHALVSRVFSSLSLLSLLGTHGDRPHARLDLPHPVNEPSPPSGASVEDVGLEPTTPGLQSLCSSRLSQSPMIAVVPGRLELPTPTLSVWCSNRLSYGTPCAGMAPRARLRPPSLSGQHRERDVGDRRRLPP